MCYYLLDLADYYSVCTHMIVWLLLTWERVSCMIYCNIGNVPTFVVARLEREVVILDENRA